MVPHNTVCCQLDLPGHLHFAQWLCLNLWCRCLVSGQSNLLRCHLLPHNMWSGHLINSPILQPQISTIRQRRKVAISTICGINHFHDRLLRLRLWNSSNSQTTEIPCRRRRQWDPSTQPVHRKVPGYALIFSVSGHLPSGGCWKHNNQESQKRVDMLVYSLCTRSLAILRSGRPELGSKRQCKISLINV